MHHRSFGLNDLLIRTAVCYVVERRRAVVPAVTAVTRTAAVIGGTSLFGGRGKTIHGVLGGLVIGGIYNGLYLLGVSSQWIDVVVAAVLLAAAVIDVLSRRGAPGQGT